MAIRRFCHMGRTYRKFIADHTYIDSDWETITDRLELNDKWHAYAALRGWNEPDIMEKKI
jgi:hypothetical protein